MKFISLKSFLYFLLLITLLSYFFILGRFRIFPYEFLSKTYHNYIEFEKDYSEETLATESYNPYPFGISIKPKDSESFFTSYLNNFQIKWQTNQVKDLKRIGGYLKLSDGSLWLLNQKDERLFKALNIINETNNWSGGVKSVFTLDDTNYAWITIDKKNCATARFYNLETLSMELELECLETKTNEAPMDGIGGGWVSFGNNEILFSTGIPADDDWFRPQLKSQDNKSPWGKILKIFSRDGLLEYSIYSKGLRNPQGIHKHHDGNFYVVNHGPKGGDFVDLIAKGKNFGWPLQSFGSQYSNEPINKDLSSIKNGKLPLKVFVPSIGISHVGACFESYKDYYAPYNCIAVSSMKDQSIYFIVFEKDKVIFSEKINFGYRIRKFEIIDDNLLAITDSGKIIKGNISLQKITPTKEN